VLTTGKGFDWPDVMPVETPWPMRIDAGGVPWPCNCRRTRLVVQEFEIANGPPDWKRINDPLCLRRGRMREAADSRRRGGLFGPSRLAERGEANGHRRSGRGKVAAGV